MSSRFVPIILFLVSSVILFPAISFQQNPAEKKQAAIITRPQSFDHKRAEHKLPCSSCHARLPDPKIPPTQEKTDYPYHTACIDCHVSDFTSKQSQLCADCHKMPLDAKGSTTQFPGKLDDFGVHRFVHRDHINPQKMPREHLNMIACDSCHKFDVKKIRADFPSHPECYTCHNHQAMQKQGTCETCHSFKEVAQQYTKDLGNAYTSYKFTHAAHLNMPSIKNNCQDQQCHATVPVDSTGQQSDINRIIPVLQGNGHTPGGCFSSSCHDVKSGGRDAACNRCHLKIPIGNI